MVAAGAPLGIELLKCLGQPLERLSVIESALYEPDSLGQPVPHLLAVWRAGMLPDGVADELAEILVGPIPAGEADKGEVRGQQSAIGQVVDGRHQLLGGQIARDAEDHHTAWTRYARHPLVALVPQRIPPIRAGGLIGGCCHFFAASS